MLRHFQVALTSEKWARRVLLSNSEIAHASEEHGKSNSLTSRKKFKRYLILMNGVKLVSLDSLLPHSQRI